MGRAFRAKVGTAARSARGRPAADGARRPAVRHSGPDVREVRPAELDPYLPAASRCSSRRWASTRRVATAARCYRARVAELVAAGRAFARFEDGRSCSRPRSARCPGVGQIQGVWVHPAHRGAVSAPPARPRWSTGWRPGPHREPVREQLQHTAPARTAGSGSSRSASSRPSCSEPDSGPSGSACFPGPGPPPPPTGLFRLCDFSARMAPVLSAFARFSPVDTRAAALTAAVSPTVLPARPLGCGLFSSDGPEDTLAAFLAAQSALVTSPGPPRAPTRPTPRRPCSPRSAPRSSPSRRRGDRARR